MHFLLALLLMVVASEAQAHHPSPLPDSITSPNLSYVVNYIDDNPYNPAAIMPGDDLDYMPAGQAQFMLNALDNSNAPSQGNPNGYEVGYTNLGFQAPDFNGTTKNVDTYDCNFHAPPTCDSGSAPKVRINMPAPNYVVSSEACLRLVIGHELFHHVQYAYITFDKWSQWGGVPVEGTARVMQDKIYNDLDANAGCITYISEVNNYLGDTNRTLWNISYTTALFWNYLMEQLAPPATEPNIGTNFIRTFWERAQANNDSPDTVGTLRETISDFDSEETLENAFHDFAIANYAKDWDVSALDDAIKYFYIDENDAAATSYNAVATAFSGVVQPVVGPNPGSVVRWGAQYYEGILGAECTGIVGFLSDGDTAGYGLLAIDTGGRVRKLSKGVASRFVRSMIQSPTDPYERLVAIVAGRDDPANYDWTFACGQPSINILRPNATYQAYVGEQPEPLPFQVRLTVTGPTELGSPTVEGLDPSDFIVYVGPVDPANLAEVISGYRVQGEYWLAVDPPDDPTPNGLNEYDLNVLLRDVASDAEADAVVYEEQILDQVVVIDRSGSMLSPAASPKLDAAKNAATLYVDASQIDDQIGVVMFGGDNVEPNDDADLLAQLQPSTDPHKGLATGQIAGIMTNPAVLTSIGDGMEKARVEFVVRGNPIGEDWIVLLSDGKENEAEFWSGIKAGILAAGIKVESIALGPSTNQTLLQAIAMDTGGDYYYVDVGTLAPLTGGGSGSMLTLAQLPNALADAYALAQERIEQRERLWEAEGTVPDSTTTVHDVEVTEGSLYEALWSFNWADPATALDVEIQRPAGGVLADGVDGVEIQAGPTHWVAQVPDLEPGTWQVSLTASSGDPEYLGILSGKPRKDARMLLYLAAVPTSASGEPAFLRGLEMPIIATLFDSGGPIGGAVVEATIRHPDGTSLLLPLFDDGAHADSEPNDGIFGNRYTRTTLPDQADPGQETEILASYNVDVVATGLTNDGAQFTRIRKGSFKVSEEQDPDPDTDGDGMPDRYELLHDCLKEGSFDAADDPDEDGIPSGDEWKMGTNPCHPDTDDGGESDGSELGRGSNPFDPRDDIIPLPIDVEVLTTVPDHGPAPDLLPEANLIRYPVSPAYETISLRRSLSPSGPFPEVANFDASAFDALYHDKGLTNGVTYYYRLVGQGPTGAESAPSHVFSGTPNAAPFGATGSILIESGAPVTSSAIATLSLPVIDTDIADMMLANESSFAGAGWQPYAPTLGGWPLAPHPITDVATVYVKYRDAAMNVSTTYQDDILVVSPAAVGEIQGIVNLDTALDPAGIAIVPTSHPDVLAAYADSAGNFSLDDLLPGSYDLLLQRSGYLPQTVNGVVVTGGTVTPIGPFTLISLPDFDGDGTPDADDNCPTIPNVQTNDADADDVGDECDICVDVANPRVASPQPWMTLIGGQRDGNGNTFGNVCDGKIIAGAAVGGGDTTEFRASFLVPIEDPLSPGQVNNACGTAANRNCDQFDMDETGAAISGADTSAVRARFLQVPGPNCGAACASITPVDTIGSLTCVGPCCPPAPPAACLP